MSIELVISGGQTGADQAGLMAAIALKIKTGGFAPKNWVTEVGPNPVLKLYGLTEYHLKGYPPRTKANVAWADATIIFSSRPGPGSRLTERYCGQLNKFCSVVPVDSRAVTVELVRAFLEIVKPTTLNIAGSRESKADGIHDFVYDVLMVTLA